MWRLFDLVYGSPSTLLVKDQGSVVASLPSLQGVK
jgi:hypothetical protein